MSAHFQFLYVAVILLGFSSAYPCLTSGAPSTEKPNVILILTDDQGYGDLACHGNEILDTPHLDRLHAESVRFTDFHVDPTCSPTRAALMTGRYAHRVGVWNTIGSGNYLRATEMTMAEVFKAGGYRTGLFGKWHLGSNYPYRPIDRGFDEWLGQGDGGTGTTGDYFTNDRVNDHYLHNGEWEYREGFAPDVFFDAAIDFVKNRDRDTPFFIHLATYNPHAPFIVPDPTWAEKYESETSSMAAYFYACIERIDHNIGLLRETLEAEGLAENTILMFLSDNGHKSGMDIYNAGMRGTKGDVYEGGHRVPFFLHWPAGNLKHGADVSDLTAHFDVLPSLIDVCGLTPPEQVEFDGRSFRSQLLEPDKPLPPRTLFVERQKELKPQKWRNTVAMTNRWRLVNRRALYDMSVDPGQKKNVIRDHPEVVKRLRSDFEAYWKRVTPHDRDPVHVVVGHPSEPETYLHSHDWALPGKMPWNHGMTSAGHEQTGTWRITAARKGDYAFDVRRWPKEANAPISGVPTMDKEIDAWDSSGGRKTLLYAGEEVPFKALPVAFIRLTVGDREIVREVSPTDTGVVFEVPLDTRDYEVTAELIDEKRRVISGAYYVYCSIQEIEGRIGQRSGGNRSKPSPEPL